MMFFFSYWLSQFHQKFVWAPLRARHPKGGGGGQRGSSSKVACVDVWQTLLQELSNPDKEILWVKVPSHVDVPGNEEADKLSKVGRMSHPLFPTNGEP